MYAPSTLCSILPSNNQTFVLLTPEIRAVPLVRGEGVFWGAGLTQLLFLGGEGRVTIRLGWVLKPSNRKKLSPKMGI